MLSKKLDNNRNQIEFVALDQLVPQDHLVRKIEKAIDFDFIYKLVEDLYCSDNGRPSVDPVVLIKMAFIQYLFGIRSMRQTIKEIETNVAYRWFLGYGFSEKIPHFTTFSKNYIRRFKDTDVFEQIFYRILREAMTKGYVDPSVAFIDSTHVKASANKKKYDKKVVRVETRKYQELLDQEVNDDREENGKKPFDPNEKEETKEKKISKTDPESGYYVKDEREKMFAYSMHTACDKKGFVLGVKVTGGNVHDSQMLDVLVEEITEKIEKPSVVSADAGYKTPYIMKYLSDKKIRPVMPYTRPKTKTDYFKKYEYTYDEFYDCYICPNDQVLSYRTTTRDGYRQYASDPKQCKNCPSLLKCTQSQNSVKLIHRHIWENHIEEADHLRHTETNKEIYSKRKETIERVFADAKEKHGMRWTYLRGLGKVSMEAMLVFAAMNLKKMASWGWNNPSPAC